MFGNHKLLQSKFSKSKFFFVESKFLIIIDFSSLSLWKRGRALRDFTFNIFTQRISTNHHWKWLSKTFGVNDIDECKNLMCSLSLFLTLSLNVVKFLVFNLTVRNQWLNDVQNKNLIKMFSSDWQCKWCLYQYNWQLNSVVECLISVMVKSDSTLSPNRRFVFISNLFQLHVEHRRY